MVWICSILALIGLLMQEAPTAATAMGPILMIPGPVIAAPFTARFTKQRWTTGALKEAPVLTVSGRMYRDSRGRERREIEIEIKESSSERISVIVISDPETGDTYILDPGTHMAILHRSRPAGRGQTKSQVATLPGAGTDSGALFEVVEGLRCRVYEANPAGQSGGTHLKDWISGALQQIIREEADGGGFSSVWRLYEIHREEPDSSLFTVPEGYTVTAGPPDQK